MTGPAHTVTLAVPADVAARLDAARAVLDLGTSLYLPALCAALRAQLPADLGAVIVWRELETWHFDLYGTATDDDGATVVRWGANYHHGADGLRYELPEAARGLLEVAAPLLGLGGGETLDLTRGTLTR